ncbi:hypothetical protein [Weissella cibaria]|uniref:hypothetical protein n=1 Tax=Bacilli TaxID=91061 RepID=UPI00215B1B3D|nr:hypothetical protein [Weissella cibaria]MCR8704193.1 hypothetical protein [Weissella cibaria]
MDQVIKFLNDFNFAITSVTGVSLWQLFKKVFASSQANQKAHEELINQLRKGQMAGLHHQVYEEGKRILSQGFVTLDELNNFEYLFEAYTALGGNGTGEVIYNRVMGLNVTEGTTTFTREAEKAHEAKGQTHE